MSEKTVKIIGIIITTLFYVGLIYAIELFLIPNDDKNRMEIHRILQVFLVYISVRKLTSIFESWRYYKIIYNIVEFPRMMWSIILKPYIKMYFAFTMFIGIVFGGIYFTLLYMPEKIFYYDMMYSTKTYLGLIFSAVIIRVSGNKLIKFFGKFHFKYDNQKEHIELSLSLINEDRIRFLIYFLFFIALVVFSVGEYENLMSNSEKNIAPVILSAFATFIAFDRLFQNWNIVDFNPKRHLKLLIEVYNKDPKYKHEDNYFIGKKGTKRPF